MLTNTFYEGCVLLTGGSIEAKLWHLDLLRYMRGFIGFWILWNCGLIRLEGDDPGWELLRGALRPEFLLLGSIYSFLFLACFLVILLIRTILLFVLLRLGSLASKII